MCLILECVFSVATGTFYGTADNGYRICFWCLFQTMECILPASPNWYCSRIVDCSVNGVACIGAKNAIDVWDVCSNPARHVCHIDAHHDRIVAVSLCHASGSEPQKCCSAGQDGKVRIWNLENKELMHEHSCHKVNCFTLIQTCL